MVHCIKYAISQYEATLSNMHEAHLSSVLAAEKPHVDDRVLHLASYVGQTFTVVHHMRSFNAGHSVVTMESIQ